MIPESALIEISAIVGQEYLSASEDMLADYATDETKLTFMPDAVVFPGTEQEVSEILRIAGRHGLPVIPRGLGSGMTGGALPVKKGIVMGMDRFDRILLIDRENLIAKVQPGVITAHLKEAAEKVGLFYPPDPASVNISTIGGNVAECAGGLRAVKYGVTKDYVLGLTVVLPTGQIIRTGVETMKGVAGYDLTSLIIGSEGTLAIITSITLRLIPKPPARKTMTAFFADVAPALATVSGLTEKGIVPAVIEFLDRHCLDCLKKEFSIPLPAGARAMLLIEADGEQVLVEHISEKIKEICHKGGALEFKEAWDAARAEELWEARRNASPSLYRLRPDKINEDIVVPRSRMAEFIRQLEEMSARYGLPVPCFGHAGDGNIHVNVMLDKKNPEEAERARELVRELFEKVIAMGGTITGEHGIGITKAPYLKMEISPDSLELMARIKKAFDPMGILNPGKIFESP